MNSVTFAGRVGTPAEQKTIPGGNTVSSFTLAIDRFKGGAKQQPLWVRVTLWGKQAEGLTPFLTKGKQIAVQGELDVREYTTREGEKRFSVEVQGRQITLLGGGQAKNETAAPAEDEMPF